jgi:hypothetical protein
MRSIEKIFSVTTNKMNDTVLMTAKEAAALLGVTTQCIAARGRIGKLQVVSDGKKKMYMIEPPGVEAPVVDATVVDASVVDATVVEEPVVDASVVDATVVEAPVVDASVVDATIVEAPVVDAPEAVEVAQVIEQYLATISNGSDRYDPDVYKLIVEYVGGPLPNMTYSELQAEFRRCGGYITPSSFMRTIKKRCFFTNKPGAGSIDMLDRSIGYIAGNIVPASPEFVAYRFMSKSKP